MHLSVSGKLFTKAPYNVNVTILGGKLGSAESTAKDRHEDSYSLNRPSFSYPKNPDSIASAYSSNKKILRQGKERKTWEDKIYRSPALFWKVIKMLLKRYVRIRGL